MWHMIWLLLPTQLYEAVLLISSLEKFIGDVFRLAVFCRFHSTRMWSLQPPSCVWTVISPLPSSSECVSFVLKLVYQVWATRFVGLIVRRRWRIAFIMTLIPVKINQFGVVGRWGFIVDIMYKSYENYKYTSHQPSPHMHTHTHTHTHAHTHRHTYTHAHTHRHTHTHGCRWWMCVGVERVCVCVCLFSYKCIYLCMHIMCVQCGSNQQTFTRQPSRCRRRRGATSPTPPQTSMKPPVCGLLSLGSRKVCDNLFFSSIWWLFYSLMWEFEACW